MNLLWWPGDKMKRVSALQQSLRSCLNTCGLFSDFVFGDWRVTWADSLQWLEGPGQAIISLYGTGALRQIAAGQ